MINLNNYETWFLLYADNELSPEEQHHVLQFIQKHPDLVEEFDALNEMRLMPDNGIVYEGKESLREEHMLETETGIFFKPDLNIVYPNKEELYRKESVAIVWWLRPLQVAAVLLIGMFWFINRPTEDIKPVVARYPRVSIDKPYAEDEKSTAVLNPKVIHPAGIKNSRQQAEAVHAARVISGIVTLSTIPANTPVQEQTIAQEATATKPVSNFTEEAVKAATARTSIEPEAASAISEPTVLQAYEEPPKSKKSPLRGLLRKITRTVLNENEENDGRNYVHVASFSIPVSKTNNK